MGRIVRRMPVGVLIAGKDPHRDRKEAGSPGTAAARKPDRNEALDKRFSPLYDLS
jgi:hypothetical protein